MAQNPDFRFQILKTPQVDGQRINIWKPAPLSEVLSLILSPTDPAIFVPAFDVDQFELPDTKLLRTTDCYSNDEIGGFSIKNGKTIVRIAPESDFVLFKGRVREDTVMSGVALPRDSRFMLLETFFSETEYEMEKVKYNAAVEKAKKDAKRQLSSRDFDDQRGRIRLV